MAPPQRPKVRTASVCTAETARGTHSFKIAGYSLFAGLGVGKAIASAAFPVGGHQWRIRYFPDGEIESSKDYVAVYLDLISKRVKVVVRLDLTLVSSAPGLSFPFVSTPTVFDAAHSSWGTSTLMKRVDVEAKCLQDDCLLMECDVTVIKGSRLEETDERVIEVQVPPSDLAENLGRFLDSGEGADVTFKVKGELFRAQKFMLAVRSPVFKAEFFGPMREEGKSVITIEDMEPAAFRALLHFIYRDSLPAMDGFDGDENGDMAKHLLVAADRYAVERMKLVCESILCKRLDVESVADTLVLADQHHCSGLKDACIGFMSSSDRMKDVVASKGYQLLKSACPAICVDIWEKTSTTSQKLQ